MSTVHLLTVAEAKKKLAEVVKAEQGSKRQASWKAAARPSWWHNNCSFTLDDGTRVCTGIFDMEDKRKWKKSHYHAALFMYEAWENGYDAAQCNLTGAPRKRKLEKVEIEIADEPKPAPRMKTRRKVEKQIAVGLTTARRSKRRGKIEQHIAEEVLEVENSESDEEDTNEEVRSRGRKNVKAKEESATLEEFSPVATPKTRSKQHCPTSSVRLVNSPTPVIRRKRTRVRKQVLKTPSQRLRTRQQRSPKLAQARGGNESLRNATKAEMTSNPIRRSRESVASGADLGTTPSHLSGSTSDMSEGSLALRTRRRSKDPSNMESPGVLENRRISPRLSNMSARSSPASARPVMRKRSISAVEGQVRTENVRMPLQEGSDRSNLQDKRGRKKRRLRDADAAPSDKENQTPPTTAKSKFSRLRSTVGQKVKSSEADRDPTVTGIMEEGEGVKELDDAEESAEQQRKAKRLAVLRECIAEAKAKRDEELQLYETEFAEFESNVNSEVRAIAQKLRSAYRSKMSMKFSKDILDMPISRFANEHGGSLDEWMIHDTEQGVNKALQALQKGEDPERDLMPPPKTPSARTRRAALAKTARKTQRMIANQAATTVRRSQRTAAKVATERNRAIISCTPRTAKNEVVFQAIRNPTLPSRMMAPGPVPKSLVGAAGICSRQGFSELAQSIQKAKNPEEAYDKFVSQLKRTAFGR